MRGVLFVFGGFSMQYNIYANNTKAFDYEMISILWQRLG